MYHKHTCRTENCSWPHLNHDSVFQMQICSEITYLSHTVTVVYGVWEVPKCVSSIHGFESVCWSTLDQTKTSLRLLDGLAWHFVKTSMFLKHEADWLEWLPDSSTRVPIMSTFLVWVNCVDSWAFWMDLSWNSGCCLTFHQVPSSGQNFTMSSALCLVPIHKKK